ncbi:MAG TPA: hypothetical protein DDY76_05135 [Opitutae bacterium]|nr:hypothetical protein [Opitutae bacterium]
MLTGGNCEEEECQGKAPGVRMGESALHEKLELGNRFVLPGILKELPKDWQKKSHANIISNLQSKVKGRWVENKWRRERDSNPWKDD